MQAAEAITVLMGIADQRHQSVKAGVTILDQPELENEQLALAIADAMLNTMLPVGRFRAFVEIATDFKADKKHPVANVTDEFTISSVTMSGIRSGIAGVAINDMDVRIVIYEQTVDGAEMVSGFQGFTKSQKFRSWLRSLDQIAEVATVQ